MSSTSPEKQPMSNGFSWNGESSSSAASAPQAGTEANRNLKTSALLAAAPRLSLQDDDSLQPPSYEDANSIRSAFLPAQSTKQQDNLGVGVQDTIEFEACDICAAML
ncbi:uncharacterized protein DFL_003771 [Arthrobotrys flagrans]|uniref:Uncharacterized protein n=1 Tax=Arthrobotrys flagrans TaxID=97331 RepID=A0A437A2Z6_ARTFL|nr:hypothetical protein DFL_003771 [Arthrobotrys flagrans]